MAALALGVAIFSTQDAIIKSISGDYAVTEAIAIRGIVAAPILAFLVRWESGWRALIEGDLRGPLLRGLILLVSYTSYYMAFPALPLAEAIALFFVSPFFVTLLAGPLLGERVSARSWAAIAIGFVGVVVIPRPGSALFEPAALLSLVSAAAYALAMIYARKLGSTRSATMMAFYQNAVYLVGALLIAITCAALGLTKLGHPSLDFLVRPWVQPASRDLLLMGSCGVIAAVAMSLLTHAYRLAEANLVTVFEYTGMLWAPLWGYLFFAETPRWTTVAGMGLILAAGLFAALGAKTEVGVETHEQGL